MSRSTLIVAAALVSIVAIGVVYRMIGVDAEVIRTIPEKPDGHAVLPDKPEAPSTIPDNAGATAKWAPAVQAKPLSENVKRGLDFLVKTQNVNGGWAQGEESQQMGRGMDQLKDKPNVADTCMAALALMRTGSTPSEGPYADNVRRSLEFICSQIEESDDKSLFITDIRGTRTQTKLGTYIDTFLVAMLLAEIKDDMPDDAGTARIAGAFHKVMDKIEKNQRDNGTWDDRGWAPALSQAMASKALNRAAQAGAVVDETVRGRAEDYARDKYDSASGDFDGEGSAGVGLYAGSASLGAMQDSANTNAELRSSLEVKASSATTPAERTEARMALDRFDANDTDLRSAKRAIIKKLEDPGFISGFGSNGGEEFLSYMNIGESLVVEGGEAWEKWDKSISENLNRIQNNDGSWTGHHCITGRTFCTSAALLVLTVDRAPVPLATQVRRR